MSAIGPRKCAPVTRWLAVAVLTVAGGCAITSSSVHWDQLRRHPQSHILTPATAVASLEAADLEVAKRLVLRITHEDPVVRLNDALSYAKLLRFIAPAPGVYEIVVEGWCDPCPVTAILWGVDELPVFVPEVTLLDSRGGQLTTIEGGVWQQDPLWRNQPIKGAWRLHLGESGPHYVLITSKPRGPTVVGHTRNYVGYAASPVGKIRVGVAKTF